MITELNLFNLRILFKRTLGVNIMDSKTTIDPTATLQDALSDNSLSKAVVDFMGESLDDIATAGCQGIDAENLDTEQITAVNIFIDVSSSMYEYAQDVADEYNKAVKALCESKDPNAQQGGNNDGNRSILIALWTFSDIAGADGCRMIHDFTPAPDCPTLTASEVSMGGMTPLYDAAKRCMRELFIYGRNLEDNGAQVKHIAIIISDGGENASPQNVTSTKLQSQASDLLRLENFILSYAFFGDESSGDQIAAEIGFPAHHRLNSSQDASGIRKLFGQFSQSVISASQGQVSANLSANAFFST